MLLLFVMHICSHISGEEEAILVISLKPPAANVFMYSLLLSLCFTKLTRLEAIKWGK